MLKALLVDRFKLVFHGGSQGDNVLALVVDRGGPRLKQASADTQSSPAPCVVPERVGTPEGDAWRAAVMEEISDTGAAARRALANDLRKLGLRLESRVIPMETIIVDHLEKSPTEN